jgi:hypothetical protein
MKTEKSFFALLLLAASSMFFSCGHHSDPYEHDGVNWNGSNGGTLELINGSSKDMVVFVGQTPSPSSLLGGVRAGATVKHDISKHVSDFAVGGYAVLRGVTKEEYDKNALDPSKAKVEFNAMVTYRSNAMYRYNINPNYMGSNGFRVLNRGKIGMELRKDSPNGEKVAYLPAMQQNQIVYTETTDALTLFPVYVYYNKSSGEVTTLESATLFESITATPRPLGASTSEIQNYYFPNDETLTWQAIVGTLKQPTAYVTVINNIANQGGYVTNALSKRYVSQNGYDAIGSGEKQVFEVESTEEGSGIGLVVVYYGGNVTVPVLYNGETDPPVIKNGYNYSVTVSYTAGEGGVQNKANYKAVIVEGSKRDVSDQISSL